MSLRGRLLLVIVLLNLGVLATVQVVSVVLQQAWRSRYVSAVQSEYERLFPGILSAVYRAEDKVGTDTVNRILDASRLRYQFRDVLITQGKPLSRGAVDLNPLGTAQRDHASFPVDEIRAGIRSAMEQRTPVPVGDGVCVPIFAGDEVAAGAWVRSILPQLPPFPFWGVALPILLSIFVFAVLASFIVNRTVGRPLQSMASAARRLGAGDYSARVRTVSTSPELRLLEGTFNAMAEEVAGHKEELESEVRRATEEAKQKERALVRSSRLASMGTLAAGVAHEINNPIGGMLNAVHRLASKEDLGERDRVYLELIREGLERVGLTARKMLDFSPRRDIQPVAFSLPSAIESARNLVEHRLRHEGVELQVELPSGLPDLWGDPHEIQQVFLNLFINSLDALDKQPPASGGGRILVGSSGVSDHSLAVEVEDNGPGVSPETLERVLDPFFSAKDDPQSTGLGLFICYAIVQNHGGELRVDSQPGAGFRVEMELPIVPHTDSAGPGENPPRPR